MAKKNDEFHFIQKTSMIFKRRTFYFFMIWLVSDMQSIQCEIFSELYTKLKYIHIILIIDTLQLRPSGLIRAASNCLSIKEKK